MRWCTRSRRRCPPRRRRDRPRRRSGFERDSSSRVCPVDTCSRLVYRASERTKAFSSFARPPHTDIATSRIVQSPPRPIVLLTLKCTLSLTACLPVVAASTLSCLCVDPLSLSLPFLSLLCGLLALKDHTCISVLSPPLRHRASPLFVPLPLRAGAIAVRARVAIRPRIHPVVIMIRARPARRRVGVLDA